MQIHNFTVCDIIRVEDNGKFLLVGVYTNGVVFQQLPTQVTLSFWMLLEHDKAGTTSFGLRGRMPDADAVQFEINGELTVADVNEWTPIGLSAAMLIGQSGTMIIEAKLSNGEWEEIRSLRILRQNQVQGRAQ